MIFTVDTDDTRAKVVIAKLINKYPVLQTDKSIMESTLSDLYMIDNGKRYYVNDGYAVQLNDNKYRVTLEV